MKPHYMDFAEEAHGDQTYGASTPYVYHLTEVCDILHGFGFTDLKWQASGALHDTLEDTGTLLETLYKEFGDEVGNIVWACTGVGKNRKDRVANILEKLGKNPDACIVKCADRIANCEAGGKLDMYRKEQEAFAEVVKPHVPKEMWERLESALNVPNVVTDLLEQAYELGIEFATSEKLDLEWDLGYKDGFNEGKYEAENIVVDKAIKRILEKSDKI